MSFVLFFNCMRSEPTKELRLFRDSVTRLVRFSAWQSGAQVQAIVMAASDLALVIAGLGVKAGKDEPGVHERYIWKYTKSNEAAFQLVRRSSGLFDFLYLAPPIAESPWAKSHTVDSITRLTGAELAKVRASLQGAFDFFY